MLWLVSIVNIDKPRDYFSISHLDNFILTTKWNVKVQISTFVLNIKAFGLSVGGHFGWVAVYVSRCKKILLQEVHVYIFQHCLLRCFIGFLITEIFNRKITLIHTWVGFLYTFVVRFHVTGVLLICLKRLTLSTIRSSFFYSELERSIHWVDVLEKLLLVWLLLNCKCVVNIPPPDPCEVQCSIDGSVFKGLHVNIGHNWTYRWPYGSFGLLKNWFWNRKCVLCRQNPSSSMMLLANKVVLFGSSVSCSSLTLMTSNADATGIDVKKDVTSNEVIHSLATQHLWKTSGS